MFFFLFSGVFIGVSSPSRTSCTISLSLESLNLSTLPLLSIDNIALLSISCFPLVFIVVVYSGISILRMPSDITARVSSSVRIVVVFLFANFLDGSLAMMLVYSLVVILFVRMLSVIVRWGDVMVLEQLVFFLALIWFLIEKTLLGCY